MEGSPGETVRETQRRAETPSPPAVGQPAREVCRDFLKGACFRENCRYAHDAAEGTVVPAQITQPICRDFQNGRCFRASCRFYHGTSADQMATALGGGGAQMFHGLNGNAMLYSGLQDMLQNSKNPQLHMMNRTMNLPMMGSAQQTENLSLEQAMLRQAALNGGMGMFDGNSAPTVAMANEILRLNAANQAAGGMCTSFDLQMLNAQQLAAAAAAMEASGGVTNSAVHQQRANYVNAMYGQGEVNGESPNRNLAKDYGTQQANAANHYRFNKDPLAQQNTWQSQSMNGAPYTNGVSHMTGLDNGAIASLPDSLVDNDFMHDPSYGAFTNPVWGTSHSNV